MTNDPTTEGEEIMESATLEPPVQEIEEPAGPDLTVKDRCDRCGAQAYVLALQTIGNETLELMFCGHHGREHMPMLGITGWDIFDFTDRINEKPSVSANAD